MCIPVTKNKTLTKQTGAAYRCGCYLKFRRICDTNFKGLGTHGLNVSLVVIWPCHLRLYVSRSRVSGPGSHQTNPDLWGHWESCSPRPPVWPLHCSCHGFSRDVSVRTLNWTGACTYYIGTYKGYSEWFVCGVVVLWESWTSVHIYGIDRNVDGCVHSCDPSNKPVKWTLYYNIQQHHQQFYNVYFYLILLQGFQVLWQTDGIMLTT